MAWWRNHLRVLPIAWLVLQVAWLPALVSPDCCAGHKAGAQSGCHESQSAKYCPMRGADGGACPMHRAADQTNTNTAQLNGRCCGPLTALLALLSLPGILPAPTAGLLHDSSSLVVATGAPDRIARIAPPDPPPPRS